MQAMTVKQNLIDRAEKAFPNHVLLVRLPTQWETIGHHSFRVCIDLFHKTYFPLTDVEGYIRRLIEAGHQVAVCEPTEEG